MKIEKHFLCKLPGKYEDDGEFGETKLHCQFMIGVLLSIYRYKNDFTVRQMAKILDVSPSTVSRIENGKEIDSKTLIKLINFIAITLIKHSVIVPVFSV